MTEERAKYQLDDEREQRQLTENVYNELLDGLLAKLADQPTLLVEHMSRDQARAFRDAIKEKYPSIM